VDWIFSDPAAGSDFSLRVFFHGTPISGVQIALDKSAQAAKTDSNGVAHFRTVPKGSYHPYSPDGLLFPSGSFEIEVDPEHASGERIEIEWPSDSIAVRNLRGRFSVSPEQGNNVEIPLRNASIELRDLRTSRLIESAQTDANGDYEFTTKDSRLYALRLTLPKDGGDGSVYHEVAIELDPAAKEISIPAMKAVQSDCNGLQLFQRSEKDDTWEAK
jgi:hypothetical protein